MHNRIFSEPRCFNGFLQKGDIKVAVTFRCHINDLGEAVIDFDDIPACAETESIFYEAYQDFSLQGETADGTSIDTSSLRFSCVDISDEFIQLTVEKCATAKLQSNISDPSRKPSLIFIIKDFKIFLGIRQKCELGEIYLTQCSPNTEDSTTRGLLTLGCNDFYKDKSDEFLKEAKKLLGYIHSILSFGLGLYFEIPVIEYHDATQVKVELTSIYSNAITTSFPVCSRANLQPLLNAAIKSHYNPLIKIENFELVIAWFVTNSTKLEARLVNYMTVLECIIESNLGKAESEILPAKEFRKNKKELRSKLKECLQNWNLDDEKKTDIISDISGKLEDLNRRSFLKKLYALAKKWSIPIDDLREEEINVAIRARNQIIHQGKSGKNIHGLWGHTMLLREISTRFILTAIGYQGVYISQYPKFDQIRFPLKVG